MTIATPGTNTSVELSWNIADPRDGQLRHVTKHDGWSFTVRERQSSAVLTAHHRDGRGGVTDYNTVDAAKAAALELMHPSEKLAWHSEDVPGTGPVHTASWGPLYFAAVTTDDGQLRFGYRVDGDPSDEVLNLPGMHDVQQWATGVLIEHYGPVRPVVDVPLPSYPQSPAESLSEAFAELMGRTVTEGDIAMALAHAELWLRPAVPRSQRAPLMSPEERLSRALYAAHLITLGYDDVAELLRRAGLSLS